MQSIVEVLILFVFKLMVVGQIGLRGRLVAKPVERVKNIADENVTRQNQ